MTQYAIECRNLTHYYGKKKVYENMNLAVPSGSVMGLLGKNGTGKTTTINILNGFLEPRSGQCLIYGEDTQHLSPETKRRIGYLIEGHVQYAFMDIYQVEKFYRGFYPGWKREAYFDLMAKLKISPGQKIATMSCGQRSQVALGLILAQNPDLLILDDFTLGLDPGYRRLFVDYLKAYGRDANKTVFLTSHIIQDVERLIEDVLIMDYGKILVQMPLTEFMSKFKQFAFDLDREDIDFLKEPLVTSMERVCQHNELYTYASEAEIRGMLDGLGLHYSNFRQVTMTLEDAFIGLTGKY